MSELRRGFLLGKRLSPESGPEEESSSKKTPKDSQAEPKAEKPEKKPEEFTPGVELPDAFNEFSEEIRNEIKKRLGEQRDLKSVEEFKEQCAKYGDPSPTEIIVPSATPDEECQSLGALLQQTFAGKGFIINRLVGLA